MLIITRRKKHIILKLFLLEIAGPWQSVQNTISATSTNHRFLLISIYFFKQILIKCPPALINNY